ncbi:RNA polymerase sigma factor [Saccharicrinis sp. FJH2]|uniref:RNA polymerase sigma factor n=1 Tax=unclassified Saccharicrinis TaxID=2646859 RepID=UPI0035D4AC85
MEINRDSKQKVRDQELVKKALGGNSAAFSSLMDFYYDAIYFTLLKMVNNYSDAEDLTAEVFGKVFKSLDQYSNDYAFSTWLFSIATNHTIDFMRKSKKLILSIEDNDDSGMEPTSVIQDDQPGPEENMIRQQEYKKLEKLIEKLKPFWQELIRLRYYNELSYEEIAEKLNLPMGTVKSQLYRAKDSLAKLYKEHKEQ